MHNFSNCLISCPIRLCCSDAAVFADLNKQTLVSTMLSYQIEMIAKTMKIKPRLKQTQNYALHSWELVIAELYRTCQFLVRQKNVGK